jgi:hypothetical protein
VCGYVIVDLSVTPQIHILCDRVRNEQSNGTLRMTSLAVMTSCSLLPVIVPGQWLGGVGWVGGGVETCLIYGLLLGGVGWVGGGIETCLIYGLLLGGVGRVGGGIETCLIYEFDTCPYTYTTNTLPICRGTGPIVFRTFWTCKDRRFIQLGVFVCVCVCVHACMCA